MAAFLIYILKSAFVLALLVSLFMLFMSRETFHRVNRYIMLSIVFIALLLPAVNLGIESPFKGLAAAIENSFAAEEPEAVVGEIAIDMSAFDELLPDVAPELPSLEPVEEKPFSWLLFAAVVYFAGVALLVVRQAVMYVQVARIIARSRVVDASLYGYEGISLRVHGGGEKPFSWFRWVVVSEDDLGDGAREILIHETAHARAGHSWDIVLADAVIIMQWFNPLAWIMKNSLKDIHEFEADEAVINSGVNAKQYQLLIIKKAVGARLYSIANSFNHSLTKKRITMMCKEKSKKWRCAKALYIVPVAAIAALAFTTVEPANAAESETLPKGSEFVANNEKETAENYVLQIPDGDEKVYQVCENAPTFPGGTHAMYKYLADNIKYPDEAKAAGKQGRVMVQFVVRKDGSISDVTVVRSVGDLSLDKEAVRAVSSMPKWNPGTQGGKPVNVQYTIPVQFKLPDGMINNEKKDTEKKDNRIVIGNGGVIVDTDVKDNALIVVDGKVFNGDLKELESSSIAHIEVIKNSALTAELKEKYNAKDKKGIIFITTSSASHAGIVGNPAPVVNGKKEVSAFTVDFNVEERTADDGEKIYQVCEIAPEYPGGLAELMRWLSMNVRYPKAARDINGQGKVFVRFVVMADGSISNAEVVKSDFTSDYSEVSLAEQTVKEIEYYKNSIERIENDCKEFEQHIDEWKNKLAVLEKDGTSENILNRRREELEKVQKLLEDERAKIVIMKRTLAQKEEMLANSKNELDEIMVTAFKNEKGEALSTDEVMALRAAAEKSLKDEAVRVVSAMPKWNPGTQGGKAVNVSFTLPIMFRLQ
ncbi:MAG: TonB family protein [Bacteroidaceae bacterium]|nr:TonB family protein [Bacteroidaceae bacterium]